MYGVFLILVLIITGGAIAFIGDRLGSKIGKKRLSIFGLRPRHTSIVITIFTGICITTLTFGVMAAASENVRTALFGMEKLHQRMTTTQRQLDEATDRLDQAQQEQAEKDAELAQTKNEVDKLQTQQEDLEAESARLQEGNRILALANAALSGQNDALAAENGSLSAENGSLLAENHSLGATNDELTRGNAKLKKDNQGLVKDNTTLEERNGVLRNGLLAMREGDIVYRAGEIISSGVIRGNRPKEAVEKDLESLMTMATRNVSVRLGKDASDQTIWVYQPEYQAAIETIAKSPYDMIVRVTAAGNLIRGEDVRASLQLYKNSVIYQKDEFIIARRYTMTGGTTQAETNVMDFLREVNMEAQMRGILPDPISGSVGVMDGTQFYDVVSRMGAISGNVVLSAYAKDNTDAMGPLRLYFKIEKLPEGQ
ncbi:MAG: DUF3084 domain-containing protein [Selenomonadaceae bacterium]|nr:DUF3084 domain-containing protein [Selenomonadaceae bacterium]MDY2686234.1 DUF3084 domain-containing protein [Selenomonadaceae bacterium]